MVRLATMVDLVLEQVGEAIPQGQAEVLARLNGVEGERAVQFCRVQGFSIFDVPRILCCMGFAKFGEICVEDFI